ncbi:MAG: AmmeMemoRadiSam system protein B [Bacteroidota bacterium]
MNKSLVIILLLMSIFSSGCDGQNSNKPRPGDRLPAVAGQFYEADSMALIKNLSSLFAQAKPCNNENVAAIITPHAGYIFSGGVAASSFNQINPERKYKTIFIIGSSHRMAFKGASIYCNGDFITPLGRVKTDTSLARKLIRENSVFADYPEAHKSEHCIEVQLPFLQFHMKKEFSIVPILIGTDDIATVKKISSALKPYFNDENLFVISSDFSHYPKYTDAVKADKLTSDAILSNSPKKLLDVLNTNEAAAIPNLVTSLCSWTSVLTLMYLTENNSAVHITELEYKNSGDAGVGDSSKVVGYTSIVFTREQSQNSGFTITEKDKKELLNVARSTLTTYIKEHKLPVIDSSDFSGTIKQQCGAFVTLKKKGDLRGCIGRFIAESPLYLTVRDMAVAASTQDPRFTAVTTDELKSIDIEISVLSPLQKITSIDEIEMGKHGIYIVKGSSTGTFLPQVATETGWTKEQFLGHCAQDKAGIGWNGWKDADIYIYTAVVFGEKDIRR